LVQSLGIVITPIISRIYTPDAFGVTAVYISIVTVLSALYSYQYDASILLPARKNDALNLLYICLILVTANTIIIIIVSVLWGHFIITHLRIEDVLPYRYLIPVSFFLNGVYSSFSFWFSRQKRFKILSVTQVVSSLSSQSFKIVLGIMGLITGGSLIVSNIIGMMFAAIMVFVLFMRESNPFTSVIVERQSTLLRRYKKFPIYNTWSSLLNNASQQLPTIILAYYFPLSIVGLYALGNMMLRMPIMFIGGSIAKVFYQKASESRSNKNNLEELVSEIFKRLFVYGLFPFIMLSILGEEVFTVAFGEQWSEAGIYIQILSMWMFLVLITSPLTNLFSIFDRQNVHLVFNIVLFVARIVTLVLGGQTGNPRIALSMYSLVGILAWIWVIYWIFTSVHCKIGIIYRYILNKLLFSLFMGFSMIMLKYYFLISPAILLCIAAVSGTIYYIIIIKNDNKLLKQLGNKGI
jgi:lipopolysaccharide exporter